MNQTVFFDNSLPLFAKLVSDDWGTEAVRDNVFLRDAIGRLTFVVIDGKHSTDERHSLADRAHAVLGRYVDRDYSTVSTPDELFDESLKNTDFARQWTLKSTIFTGQINLVDRRIIGGDWLRAPYPSSSLPVRIAFASLKGGVGRSTALCVIAAHLAARGRRVLAIDLDLEAPGLGNMLLPDETLPDFGLLDWLAERSVGPVVDEFYPDVVAPSWLGGGRGRVDVVPALGRRSLSNPTNVLAKLARAYLGGQGNSDKTPSFVEEVRVFVDHMGNPDNYDVVLVDTRAGLHETTAASVTGLGAEVLLFGGDQRQTYTGFDLLLAQLSTFPVREEDDWRDQLHFVQSKALDDPRARLAFAQRLEVLQRKYLWPTVTPVEGGANVTELADIFEVEWEEPAVGLPLADEELGPWPVIALLDDDQFRTFDPVADRDSLSEITYRRAFGEILDLAGRLVDEALQKLGAPDGDN